MPPRHKVGESAVFPLVRQAWRGFAATACLKTAAEALSVSNIPNEPGAFPVNRAAGKNDRHASF